MNIALLGYGKMGQGIAAYAETKGHTIVARINSAHALSDQLQQALQADVWIEFSRPELAIQHIETAITHAKPIVVGTTGWYSHLQYVSERVNQTKATVFYARNFSLGVHLFFKLNQKLAQLMQAHPEYAIQIEEWHHLQKLDAPSGTALELCDQTLKYNKRYIDWSLHADNSHTIPVKAIRQADITGTHQVMYQSAADRVELRHHAFNRNGFIYGALCAAEFVLQHNGLLTMDDMWPDV